MKKFSILLLFVISGISLHTSMEASAAGTLISLSSAAHDGGNFDEAYDVAVDTSNNIIVTGSSSNGADQDYFSIKYNSNLVMLSSATFDGGSGDDNARGVAINSSGNIFVTGYTFNGSNYDYYTIKYDKNMGSLDSRAIDYGASNDLCYGIAADDIGGNIFLAGVYGSDFWTIKCIVGDLSAVGSDVYDGGSSDEAYAVAVGTAGDVIVTGYVNNGGQNDYFTIKYDNNLVAQSSVTYNSGLDDTPWGVAVDNSGNIIVTGEKNNGSNKDFFTIKYDSNLVVLSSATYDSGSDDAPRGVAVDASGNIIVAGYTYNGSNNDFLTIKYDSNLVVLSSAVYDGGASDSAKGVAVDASGNIIVTGVKGGDYFTIKYLGSSSAPSITTVSPTEANPGQTLDVIITGTNFYSGADVVSSGSGITRNSQTVDSNTQITVNITIASDAATGKRDVTVTNIDDASVTKSSAFEIRSNSSKESTIDKDTDNTVTLEAEAGDIVVEVPANTFSDDIVMTVATADVAAADRPTLKKTQIGIDISVSSGEQPLKDMTVKVYYRDADIVGLNEKRLTLCRYDEIRERWIPLPTVVYTDDNYLEATIDHLSKFGILQLTAASDLDTSKVFPNPYNPLTDGNLTFDNLTSEASIKIYTVAGVLVRELAESDGDSRLQWDGKNDGGETVASGVYIAYIESDNDTKILKIAVVK